jgi:dephospho-CoA kinase
VVIDAPLLVELGSHRQMDKLIVVTSTRSQQIERLKDRDGANPEEALKMVSSQMPLEEKLKFADYVIQNEGSLEAMERKTREIFKELRKDAHQMKKR